jgi:hypothetical protein
MLLLENNPWPIYFDTSSMEAAIEGVQTQENNNDIEADSGWISTGVEILLQISHKALTSSEEHIK